MICLIHSPKIHGLMTTKKIRHKLKKHNNQNQMNLFLKFNNNPQSPNQAKSRNKQTFNKGLKKLSKTQANI